MEGKNALMDLNAVSQILKGLLIRDGKVSLPEAGTFVMNDVPAEFIGGGKSIAPPSKEILFNNFEIADDGILENEYAKAKEITLEKSRQEISEYVSFLKREITDNSRFVIKGFGVLSLSKDYNFVFVPDSALVISPDSFGLDTVKIDSGKNEDESIGEAVNGNEQNSIVEDKSGANNETADNEAADDETAVVEEVVSKDNAAIAEAVSRDGAVAIAVNKNDLAMPDVSVKSSVADVYKISPALMPPEVGKRSETMKGTIIVDSDNDEKVKKTGTDADNGKQKRSTRIADVLFFTKSDKKAGVEKKGVSFIPSAGVLGGHSYVFGQPIHSQATEVVVINEKGKYEIKLKGSAGTAKGIKGKTNLSGGNYGDAENNGPIQSAVGAIDVSQRAENVNDVEIGVITGAAQTNNIEEDNGLSQEEIEKRELREKEAIEASELAAEKLIKHAHQQKIDDQHRIEEALAEAERIESEKKAAKLEYEKSMEAAKGRPVIDTEGQDEAAKESIADIFTKAAEKESKMPVAQIVGEKESGKDWSAAENPVTAAADFSGEISPVQESEGPESIGFNGVEQPDTEQVEKEQVEKKQQSVTDGIVSEAASGAEVKGSEKAGEEYGHVAAKEETKNVTKKISKRAAEKAARRNERKKKEEKLEQEKKDKIELKKQKEEAKFKKEREEREKKTNLKKQKQENQEAKRLAAKQKAAQEKRDKIERKKQAVLDKRNKIEQEKRIAHAKKEEAAQKLIAENRSSDSKKMEPSQKHTVKTAKVAQTSQTHKVFVAVAYIIAILVIIALLIYVFREPLRPLLEKLMYSQDELNIINYKI